MNQKLDLLKKMNFDDFKSSWNKFLNEEITLKQEKNHYLLDLMINSQNYSYFEQKLNWLIKSPNNSKIILNYLIHEDPKEFYQYSYKNELFLKILKNQNSHFYKFKQFLGIEKNNPMQLFFNIIRNHEQLKSFFAVYPLFLKQTQDSHDLKVKLLENVGPALGLGGGFEAFQDKVKIPDYENLSKSLEVLMQNQFAFEHWINPENKFFYKTAGSHYAEHYYNLCKNFSDLYIRALLPVSTLILYHFKQNPVTSVPENYALEKLANLMQAASDNCIDLIIKEKIKSINSIVKKSWSMILGKDNIEHNSNVLSTLNTNNQSKITFPSQEVHDLSNIPTNSLNDMFENDSDVKTFKNTKKILQTLKPKSI